MSSGKANKNQRDDTPLVAEKKKKQVEAEESEEDEEFFDEEDEEEEFDLIEAMNAMGLKERRKVYALKGLQKEYNELLHQFRLEVAELELAQHKARQAGFTKRAAIINGEVEVTQEEVAEAKKELGTSYEGNKEGEQNPKGIPDFWLSTLKHHETINSRINDQDTEILKFCTAIRAQPLDGHPELGFVLEFDFGANPYFEHSTLTKTCHWEQERRGTDNETIKKMEATKIKWSAPEKNPCVKIVEKKQRHKNGKGVRVIKKEVRVDSFFNFFDPIQLDEDGVPVGDFDEEEEEELQQRISLDEDMTLCIESTIVPRAASIYTGEQLAKQAAALQAAFGMFGGGQGFDDDEDEEEETDESEEDEPVRKPTGGRGGGRGGAKKGGGHQDPNQQECKQQ